MQFTRDLDFATFDMANFQSVSISDQNMDSFIITYAQATASSYRITVEPKGYIFLYNSTVSVTTVDPPTPFHTSADTMPFKDTVYQATFSSTWFLMQSPSMS